MSSHDKKTISAAQLRAARALLGISADELAALATVGVATVRRAEKDGGEVVITPANRLRLLEALYEAGVEVIEENGGGAGVRLRKGFFRRP